MINDVITNNIIEKFEMEYRVFNGKITDEVFEFDNSKVQFILENERKKADNFLEKALN